MWTADGVAVAEISTRLGLHRSTVIFWRQRFVEEQSQGRPVVERLRDRPRAGRPAQFTPAQVAQIKAVACEQPAKLELPLSRFSLSEIALWIKQADIVTAIGTSTIWRLLHQDAIRPWYYRGWLFPRDPAFVAKASVILDLYQRCWHGQPLGPRDYVLSADEKSALQVLARPHPTLAPAAGQPGRYEFEYIRNGTLAYLAALDVGSGQVFGRIDAIQDRRTRHVSNWLTVPLFLLAWPAALLTDRFVLTFAVFIGVYVATKLEPRAGATDGKLMVGLAAFAPLALGLGVLLEAVVFIFLRMRRRNDATIPGALWLYIGSVLSAVAQIILAQIAVRASAPVML